jgi:hypothetical protein
MTKLLSHVSLDTKTVKLMLLLPLMVLKKVANLFFSNTSEKPTMVMKVFLIKLLNSLLLTEINQPRLSLVLPPQLPLMPQQKPPSPQNEHRSY